MLVLKSKLILSMNFFYFCNFSIMLNMCIVPGVYNRNGFDEFAIFVMQIQCFGLVLTFQYPLRFKIYFIYFMIIVYFYDFSVAQSTKLLMAFVIFLSYSIQFYVPMEAINRKLKERKSDRYENVIQISVRTFIVCFSGENIYYFE